MTKRAGKLARAVSALVALSASTSDNECIINLLLVWPLVVVHAFAFKRVMLFLLQPCFLYQLVGQITLRVFKYKNAGFRRPNKAN